VGQTTQTLSNRWKQHLRDSVKLDYPLYRAMRKYSVGAFYIEEISTHTNLDELNKAETEMIAMFNSNDEKFGYNILPGGKNYKMPQEIKDKISKANKGKKYIPHISSEEKSKIARENGMKAVKNLEGIKKFHLNNPNFNKEQSLLLMQDPYRIEHLRRKAIEQFSSIEKRNEMSIAKGGKVFRLTNKDGNVVYCGSNQHECARLLKVSQRAVNKWVLGLNKSKKYFIEIMKEEN